MLSLEKIILTQYRNYTFREFALTAPVIGIAGLNGSGKTNLLDAVYYLCYTKSYFQNREVNNVQRGQSGFRIAGIWKDSVANETSDVVCVWKEGKKTITHNNNEYEKIADHIGKYNAVMIAPDDIELINEGSDLRRKYMDGILSQQDTKYFSSLLQYQKVLQQRNAYLKEPHKVTDHKLLDIYDEQLTQYGSYLVAQRLELSNEIPGLVQHYYRQLSSDREQVHIIYKYCAQPPELLQKLYDARPRDIELKRTTQGPHTEDWQFVMGQELFKTHASQGQKKSFLISLKLAHISLLHRLEKYPVLLLDDIFEKLDKKRLARLFELIHDFTIPQIFITHTDATELQHHLSDFSKDVLMIAL